MPKTSSEQTQNLPRQGLERFLQGRILTLQRIIADLEAEVTSRHELTKSLIGDIDQRELELRCKILELEPWRFGTSQIIDQHRFNLEKELRTFSQQRHAELARCWQDTARLASEMRVWYKEFCELSQRAQILGWYAPKKEVSREDEKYAGRSAFSSEKEYLASGRP